MPPEHLILGRVIRTHGIRGEVKLLLQAESWAPFQSFRRLWLAAPGAPFRPFAVEAAREQDRTVLLKLAGVDSPEAAARLVGQEVGVPRADAPPPPEGSFYHYDILGLQVVHGTVGLGTVEEILETPAHDVYVVRGPAGEWMLPATRRHIRRIDLAARRVELDPATDVSGLLAGGEEAP